MVGHQEDLPGALSEALRTITPGGLDHDLDIRLFEELPMYLKAAVLRDHEVLVSQDEGDLYEYLYFFRKLWEDQAHRQSLTAEEARRLVRGEG